MTVRNIKLNSNSIPEVMPTNNDLDFLKIERFGGKVYLAKDDDPKFILYKLHGIIRLCDCGFSRCKCTKEVNYIWVSMYNTEGTSLCVFPSEYRKTGFPDINTAIQVALRNNWTVKQLNGSDFVRLFESNEPVFTPIRENK